MYYQGSCTSWCKIQHHMGVTANTNAIFWKQWLLFRPFSYASAGAPKYFAQGLQIAKTVTANHNQKNNIKTKLNGCFWFQSFSIFGTLSKYKALWLGGTISEVKKKSHFTGNNLQRSNCMHQSWLTRQSIDGLFKHICNHFDEDQRFFYFSHFHTAGFQKRSWKRTDEELKSNLRKQTGTMSGLVLGR